MGKNPGYVSLPLGRGREKVNALAMLDELEERAGSLPKEIRTLANQLNKEKLNRLFDRLLREYNRRMLFSVWYGGGRIPFGLLTQQILIGGGKIEVVWLHGIAIGREKSALKVAFEFWTQGYIVLTLEQYKKFFEELKKLIPRENHNPGKII
jgi:hypothetical protein